MIRRQRSSRSSSSATCHAALGAALWLALLASPAASPAAASPSLDDLLGSPFPSGMVASDDGSRLAWVVNERGVRNIWGATAPDWRGRALTEQTEDDGITLYGLAFSPSGRRLAGVRGDGPNRAGELPDPLHTPGGEERAIYVLDWETGETRRVAEGAAPLFRSETELLFVHQGSVWRADLAELGAAARGADDPAGSGVGAEDGERQGDADEEAEIEAERLLQLRGGFSGLRLSPDRSLLAFTSTRGSHSFVGVYSFADDVVRFLDPGVDRDVSPVFSPDGREVAFLRLPASTEPSIFAPQREGAPWSIRVAPAAGGPGREVFRAEPGRGSVFRGVVSDRQIHWTADGVLVFPWERDGWTHLYAVEPAGGGASAQGSAARLLTPGAFEVEYVALDLAGTSVLYSSNQEDIDRRHLWRVGARDGRPRPLTSGPGVENVPVALAEGGVGYVGASGTRPLQPLRLDAAGRTAALMPEALASYPDGLVEPEAVRFRATDGLEIHGQLFLPAAGGDRARRPAVVFLHGGSRRHMMLGWHYSPYYHHCYSFHQYLASRGFVVLSVNYRSGIGYGLEFREALDYGATGASELRDVLGAGLYLQSRPEVDPERIGLWGGSYGGYLTAMGLSRASHLFAAGVDIHGVHDWNRTIQNFIPSYEPLRDPEAARRAFESSPLAQVEDWRSPVLLIHGDDDRNVPFLETIELVERLREHGHVEPEILVFPDEVHSFLRYSSWLEALGRAADFFQRTLDGRTD